jgi:hypothetical protein
MVGSLVEKSQRARIASGQSHETMEELDQLEMFVGPKDPAVFRCEHVAKMGWFKARNKKGGANQIVLGNLIVVGIFSFLDLTLGEPSRLSCNTSGKKISKFRSWVTCGDSETTSFTMGASRAIAWSALRCCGGFRRDLRSCLQRSKSIRWW